MKDLTPIQQSTLEFIEDWIHSVGYPPSIREIGKKYGISTRAVQDRLILLQKKGYIEMESHKPRTLRVKYPRLYRATADAPEHGIKTDDYVHVQNGTEVIGITRMI